jgi:predicted NAD/FAD-dependent oxidoreductase
MARIGTQAPEWCTTAYHGGGEVELSSAEYRGNTQPLGTPLLWDADACLGVCGDWTHGARVEDAFISGELLARAMLGEKPLSASHS